MSRPCPASCQLAGQRFVVFSYMCDECEGEPALCLHAAFDSGEDTRAFAKCVGGRMPDANVDVAEVRGSPNENPSSNATSAAPVCAPLPGPARLSQG